jgi:hypothetical protein
MSETKTTRRGIVAGGLALLGGLGLGAAATSRATDGAERAGRTLALRAPRLRLGDPDARPGIPGRPSRLEGEAQLLDAHGRAAGTFSSVVLPSGRDGVELHTFQLEGGTLLGMGRVGGYAVVGGTGTYAGASGAYTFGHRAEQLGGDGSAHFVINLTA